MFGNWACLRQLGACSHAALASPAAAGLSGVIATETRSHPAPRHKKPWVAVVPNCSIGVSVAARVTRRRLRDASSGIEQVARPLLFGRHAVDRGVPPRDDRARCIRPAPDHEQPADDPTAWRARGPRASSPQRDRHEEPTYSLLTEAQKKKFERRASSTSRSASGVSRFRGNLYLQKGAVGGAFRMIPAPDTAAADARRLGFVPELCSLPRGLVLVTGRPAAGRARRLAAMIDQGQPRAQRAHRHGRGSDRVRPTSTRAAS